VIELEYALLADGATPRPDGKIDLFGAGIDVIYASSVPTRHPFISLVARMFADPDDVKVAHALEIIFRQADGEEIARTEQEIPEAAGTEMTRPDGKHAIGIVLQFRELVFAEYGVYSVDLVLDGKALRKPLRLDVAEPNAE
jgi:hypothetical protein